MLQRQQQQQRQHKLLLPWWQWPAPQVQPPELMPPKLWLPRHPRLPQRLQPPKPLTLWLQQPLQHLRKLAHSSPSQLLRPSRQLCLLRPCLSPPPPLLLQCLWLSRSQ